MFSYEVALEAPPKWAVCAGSTDLGGSAVSAAFLDAEGHIFGIVYTPGLLHRETRMWAALIAEEQMWLCSGQLQFQITISLVLENPQQGCKARKHVLLCRIMILDNVHKTWKDLKQWASFSVVRHISQLFPSPLPLPLKGVWLLESTCASLGTFHCHQYLLLRKRCMTHQSLGTQCCPKRHRQDHSFLTNTFQPIDS